MAAIWPCTVLAVYFTTHRAPCDKSTIKTTPLVNYINSYMPHFETHFGPPVLTRHATTS